MKNLSHIALLVLIVGVICLLVAPYVFTRPGNISFKETGTIGDTIGGITAPITGLIGSVLVFLALRAQIVANEIIQGQIRDQKKEDEMKKEVGYLSDLYKYFLSSIDNLQLSGNKGVGVIMELMNTSVRWERKLSHNNFNQGKIAELYGILTLGKMFLQQVAKSNVDKRDKDYFKELIKHHIDSFILPYLSMESDKPVCEICGEMHNGVPIKIKELVGEIESFY